MNEENLPPEIPASPKAEPLSEAKETQINRMAGCSRLGRLLLLLLLLAAGALFLYDWMMTGAGRRVLSVKTKAVMQDVKVAAGHFKTEYNGLPLPGLLKGQETDVKVESRGRWLSALLGKDTGINLRGIKFVDLPVAKEGKFGLIEQSGETVLVDPWGKAYVVIFDANFDNLITNPDDRKGSSGEETPEPIKGSMILYSGGADGNLDTWDDNVCSWR